MQAPDSETFREKDVAARSLGRSEEAARENTSPNVAARAPDFPSPSTSIIGCVPEVARLSRCGRYRIGCTVGHRWSDINRIGDPQGREGGGRGREKGDERPRRDEDGTRPREEGDVEDATPARQEPRRSRSPTTGHTQGVSTGRTLRYGPGSPASNAGGESLVYAPGQDAPRSSATLSSPSSPPRSIYLHLCRTARPGSVCVPGRNRAAGSRCATQCRGVMCDDKPLGISPDPSAVGLTQSQTNVRRIIDCGRSISYGLPWHIDCRTAAA